MKIIIITILTVAGFGQAFAQDTLLRKTPGQITLLYPIGTSGQISEQQNYNCSINLLAGYTGQVKGFEMAGLVNINKSAVSGFQLAGWLNKTNGQFTGGRLAGILNINRQQVHGFQVAGIANISGQEVNGGCMAGLFNHTKTGLNGFQLSGLFNIVQGKARGVQLAGLFNKAKILNGVQLAVLNISDTVENGINIGLCNVVKNGGYNQWELSVADYQHLGIAFKHGIKKCYNIYSVGANFIGEHLWAAGLGFGHTLEMTQKLDFQPEAIVTTYFPGDFKAYTRTISYKLKLNLAYEVSGKIAVSLAPGIYYADKEKGKNERYGYEFTSINPFFERTNKENRSELGLGFSIGLAFSNN